MSTIKVIELMANSPNSWEEAAQNAINEAGSTLKGIKSIYIKEQSAEVEGNKITSYRITAKVSFEIFHHESKG
ncbi:MAG TPA: dodecin family protein [Sphingobacteriaceae bacterium]